MRKLSICIAALLIVSCAAGCAGSSDSALPEEEAKAAVMTANASLKRAVLFADPAGAAEAIYQSIDPAPQAEAVSPEDAEAVFGLSEQDVAELVAYTSDAKGGLCDIAIVLPAAGSTDDVRDALGKYCVARAGEFKNYDILGAYDIASGAVVFDQGDYVVLLMTADNDAAQEILDEYMPR